jgi:hypothetical protein
MRRTQAHKEAVRKDEIGANPTGGPVLNQPAIYPTVRPLIAKR